MLHFKWTLNEEMLGSASNNKDLHHDYIASKAPDAASTAEEVEALGVEAVEEKGITIFPKMEDGTPFVWDYQIRGFLKESFSALSKAGKAGYYGGRHCANLKAFKKAVDQHIFVTPRKIPLRVPDEASMGYCVRPLRADTPQGARVALAKSETVPAGTTMEFDVLCLIPELEECVNEAMEYGYLHGFGQWRNSGKGSFTFDYEIIDDPEPEIPEEPDKVEEPVEKPKRGRKKKAETADEEKPKRGRKKKTDPEPEAEAETEIEAQPE